MVRSPLKFRALALALACARVAGAQSVPSDTIYALAVDSTKYPEQSSVLLLDDGVVRVEKDGRNSRTYRQVVQILRQDAVGDYQERRFGYDPLRQKLTINWIHVVAPNGTIVSDKAGQMQESDVPAAMNDPVYVSHKVVRASLTGVAVGTLVDISYTTEDTAAPYRAGDFFDSWFVSGGTAIRRSRLVLDAPKDFAVRMAEHNLNFPRRETVVGDRRVYTWATSDVAWNKAEPFEADSNGIDMWLATAAPGTWADIGRWYAGLARDRYAITPELRAKIHELVAHAATREDSIRAVHRWVAQDIRYVSVALGLSGYQPRTPAAVMQTGFGDCKDKATLFVTALSAMGIEAYPVLLNAGGRVDRSLPTIVQFDHAIAAIKRPTGYQYVDLTSELTPFGELPYPDAGEFALVVHPDGRTEEVTIPAVPIDSNRLESRVAGTLSSDGTFNGRYTESASGIAQYALRGAFREPLDSMRRAGFLRVVASTLFPGAAGDSLVAFDGKDLAAPVRIGLDVRHGQATTRSGDTEILQMPAMSENKVGALADDIAARGPRRTPIDASKVMGVTTVYSEYRITLPDGWHARLPASLSAPSVFGSYNAQYRQNGRELLITRTLAGSTAILPPARIDDLIAWLRTIATDRVPFIVLDRGSEPATTSKTSHPG
jgi:hypothetical protein